MYKRGTNVTRTTLFIERGVKMKYDREYYKGVILTFLSLAGLSKSIQADNGFYIFLSIVLLVVGFSMVLTGYIK